MSEEIDAIVFDAGGTLFDLKPSKEEVFHSVLRSLGSRATQDEVAAIIAKAERKFDIDAADLDGVHDQAFWIKYDNYVLQSLGYEGDFDAFSKALSNEFQNI